MAELDRAVTLCGRRLVGVRHVCAFFDSRDEEHEILNPYFAEGLEQGDEVLTIFDRGDHADRLARMERGGIDVGPALQSGQLKLKASDETYVDGGAFAAERMLQVLRSVLEAAEQGPWQRVRTCGDMGWALQGFPGCDELIEYECRVNMLTTQTQHTLLCIYDVNRFSGRVIADVLATHSHVVLGGRVHENPHFAEPIEFLRRQTQRRQSLPLAAA